MKKVGIVTTYVSFQNNYGAVLQGYALSKQIELLGYRPVIIPYIPDSQMPSVWKNKIVTRKKLSFYRLLRLWCRRTIDKYFPHEIIKKRKSFSKFEKDFLPVLTGQLQTVQMLEKNVNGYHAFVCGSDQIWNPRLTNGLNDKGYFLDFLPNGIKRIAYAPSIGNSQIPDTAKSDLGELLGKFDALSVRENSGKRIIKEVCGLDVPVVLDPTLLLPTNEWDNLITDIKKYVPNKYIFVYRFGKVSETLEQIRLVAQYINLPVVEIPMDDTQLNDGFIHFSNAGPREFVSLIKNAQLVLTDSFHASVFSIIQHTPFITFCREYNTGNNMNSRMIELLDMSGLSERMIMPEQQVDLNKLFEISFDEADKSISKRREKDLNYLRNALIQGDDNE